ncbi:hypothetical protein JVU11DRAFT_9008 [Chiua virens]|nr:hypothetical protein JVU11DRAFT_9008 [Chiua virens]
MFSRSLLARSSPLRLSVTRLCSRSLSALHFAQPARWAAPLSTTVRRFSAAAPTLRTETRDDARTSPKPTGTCYVANLPYKATAEQLQDAFSEFGKIKSVRLMTTDAGMSRGVGFVQFESIADAVHFVDSHVADPIYVFDRQLFVEHAQNSSIGSKFAEPSDTLMLPGIQGESDDEVRTRFGAFADSILAVRFHQKNENPSSRSAFIQFQDASIATEAMDAFKNQNGAALIAYARHRQSPTKSSSLSSRLSQHRAH